PANLAGSRRDDPVRVVINELFSRVPIHILETDAAHRDAVRNRHHEAARSAIGVHVVDRVLVSPETISLVDGPSADVKTPIAGNIDTFDRNTRIWLVDTQPVLLPRVDSGTANGGPM